MSSIRVSGNTSGYYDLTVPDVAGQNTIPLDRLVTTDANGNLGIGTTSPQSTLHLGNNTVTGEVATQFQNSGVAGAFIGVEGSSGNRFLGSSTDNMFIGTTSADGLE